MSEILPYIWGVDIFGVDDNLVLEQAESGLRQQGVLYTKKVTPSGVFFFIQGEFDDGALLRIQNFIHNFYTKWGRQYIRFSVELKNDWLKDNSFSYGELEFIKTGPEEWHFKTR